MKTWGKWVSGVVVVALLGAQPAVAEQADPGEGRVAGVEERATWTLEERQAYGAQNAPQLPPVQVVASTELLSAPVEVEPMPPGAPVAAPVWPHAGPVDFETDAAASSRAEDFVRVQMLSDLPAVSVTGDPERPPGSSTVGTGRAMTPGSVGAVEVLDRAQAQGAGVDVGVRLQVPAQVEGALVEVAFDYAGFAQAHGGDWASRLQVVALPQCALSDPTAAGCS